MQIIDDYRALHQIPELGRTLPKTLSYITNSLTGLPCQVFSPAEGALCAWFDFGHSSTLAFRADMDGLPIAENTGLSYASVHPGQMHACGHDGHTAILLELARRLTPSVSRNVLLIFQPAEETDGGAREICESGVLERYNVEAVFGLHLWPDLPAGILFSRPGAMMSHACQVTVRIVGQSTHITQDAGRDALAAGVEFYRQATALEARFGKMVSGTARNCVSAETRLEGTLRTLDDREHARIRSALLALGSELEKSTGCGIEIALSQGYPAVTNPPRLCESVQKIAPFRTLSCPTLATEDFSYYQRRVPGMFFFLGLGSVPPLHAADFRFDEELLSAGADFWETIAQNCR